MGQREAAETTREHFGLETFSHTTLGRAMKRFEELLNTGAAEAKSDEAAAERPQEEKARSFPTVGHLKERKEKVLSCMKEAAGENGAPLQEPPEQKQKRPPYAGAFIDTCHKIVGHIFLKYRRLLL